MAEDSVADDILRNGFERWQRLEGEKQAISEDLKELFSELKNQGFDGKALRAAFRDVAKVDDADVQEHNAVVDLYVNSLLRGRSAKVGTIPATHSRAARETEAEDRNDALSALRADPAMSIVDVSTIKKSEPQSAPQTGSDLTQAPAYDPGQVATHSEPQESEAATSPAQMPSENTVAVVTSPDRAEGIEDGQPVKVADKSVEAKASAAPAPKYAEPGVIVWETTPPEGVERGAISTAFADMGQDLTVIADDLEKAGAAPIVKKGKVILDGWARYVKARELGVEYSVVQYAGDDILTDVIKLNVEGRILNDDQKRKIAENLARQEPSRKDDIYKAFALWMEPV